MLDRQAAGFAAENGNGGIAENFRAFNMFPTITTAPGVVPLVENCFAFMFTNIGDTTALVNGMVIFPSATPLVSLGDSRSIAGHWMDLYKGNINVAFVQPVGAAPQVEIVQLAYVLPFKYR